MTPVLQLIKAGVPPSNIRAICVTHLHGDHCFGLAGVLNQVSTSRAARGVLKEEPLLVFGPPGIQQLVAACFKVGCDRMCSGVRC